MKTSYGTILFLAMATVILLITPLPCGAVEKEGEKKVWLKDKPKRAYKGFELTEEKIEHIMAWLAESDPEKAKELAQLKKKDPEKFKVEIIKAKQKKYGKYDEKHREGQKSHPKKGMQMGGSGAPGGGRREMMRERMHDRHAEYLEWLEKNYPGKAEKLAELKGKKPELYMKRLRIGHERHRRIMEAERENPQLAEVLKQDLDLKRKRGKLLRKIRAAVNADQKEKLVKELKEVVSQRFDLIVKRKQIWYEQLSRELEKLKKRVKRSEAEIEKWKEVKDKEVKERLKELISRTEEFKWD